MYQKDEDVNAGKSRDNCIVGHMSRILNSVYDTIRLISYYMGISTGAGLRVLDTYTLQCTDPV